VSTGANPCGLASVKADVLFDLREVLRGLVRDRGYSAVVVITLALTIGATTAVFAIVNSILLKPLAYHEPHRLVVVNEVVRELSDQYPRLPVNPRHFDRWRERATTFESMAAYNTAPANLTGLGEAAQIETVRTSGALFEVLNVQPAIGRLLNRDDEAADKPRVAVISHAMWRDRMSGDPEAIGRSIVVNGAEHTVVGVLPADVRIPVFSQLIGPGQLNPPADVFVPLRLNFQSMSLMGEFNYAVVGRLKAGATIDGARAELDVLQAGIAREAAQEIKQSVGLRATVRPLDESIVGSAQRGLILLLAAIAAVLLVACSNLANLSLTRTLARLRDAAIRTALGATGRRLVGRVVLEQLLLAAAGGALGLGVAALALRLFVTTAPIDLPRVAEVAIDFRVLAFALFAAAFAGLAVAIVPAWRMAGRDVQDVLRSGGGTTLGGAGLRARSVLLTVQVGLAVTLLTVTTLLTMSFVRLLRSDRGFSPEGVTAVDVSMPASRYPNQEKVTAGYDELLERIQAIPGVSSASWVSALPLSGENWVDGIQGVGETRALSQVPTANYRFVGPDYFRTMGMPLRRGRAFTASERTGPTLPAIITERTAAVAWPGVDPIGQRFIRGDPKQTPFEVVGIIADGHNTQIDAVSPLMVYVPYWFRSRLTVSLVARGAIDAAALGAEVRRVTKAFDAEIAIARVRPLQQLVDAALAARRHQVTVFLVFGAVGFLIAMIGVYGTTGYGVSRRRREMNIRLALGASPPAVLALVVRHSMIPLAIGVAVGVVAAVAASAVVASLLFEMSARDPRVIAGVAALAGASGILSSYTAARNGLRLDPAAVLRED
jgi:putative ABC transport system permease protein